MKGYPKYINCKQDYINLLAEPEHQEQAIEDLKVIRDLDDDKALRTISINEETGEAVTELPAENYLQCCTRYARCGNQL